MSESIASAIEPWARPVEGPSPVGAEPRSLPPYQALREEIAKLESPAAGPCRWEVVEREASAVLALSKDLASASYLAGALAQRRGLEGLALGTTLLASLLERFEAPHPARPRARANAIAWYLERAEHLASTATVGAADRAHVMALERAVASLRNASAERLGDDAPGTHRLAEAVQRLVLTLPPDSPPPPVPVPVPVPEPAPARAIAAPPAPPAPRPPVVAAPPSFAAPATTPALPDTPDDPQRLPQYLLQLGSALLTTAKSLRDPSAPHDPTALRLFLDGLYLPVTQVPPPSKGRRTGMPAPTAALRQELEHAGDADLARALDTCLRALEKHRFWLDAHLALHKSLTSSRAAREAAEVHAGAVRALVTRLPGLLEADFADGTPFASDETRTWLASPSGSARASSAESDAASPLETALREAKDALRAGKTGDALARAHDAVRLATTARDRFLARLELATLALDAKAAPVALALAAELHREAEARDLGAWDAPLAARACALYLRAGKDERDPSALPFARSEVFARLCLLDPAAAAQISRG